MEQRQFHRIPFQTEAKLVQNHKSWQTVIVDLSLHGALINYPTDFEGDLSEVFELMFHLSSVGKDISLIGKVVHNANDSLGFSIQQMDIDSATELRNLVSFNLGDETAIQQDLKALAAD